MVQGTCSGAGKSLLVAGLARVLSDMGVRVAPYKSQNMALNSFVTEDGSEIGRAQAFQAEAARIRPVVDINPILLKAASDTGCQVIVNGRVHANMSAVEYYAFRQKAWHAASGAYDRLSRQYDVIVIEGAGSPAEINLKDEEIVNMAVARHADCPVLVVGDIDRGGVFASFYGTVGLLDEDAKRIKGFVVNKFRGDKGILEPGLEMIWDRTGVPVIGVIPYVSNLRLDEEDALSIRRHLPHKRGHGLKVVIVSLGYISNFTDFDPFMYEPDVELLYSTNRGDIESADMVVVPGSKNTVKDLLGMKRAGIDKSIRRAAENGAHVVGICGGYQMLGAKISDPHGVESEHAEVEGMGLLDVETGIMDKKTTAQTEAETELFGNRGMLRGYEIHMGITKGDVGLFTLKRLSGGPGIKDGSIKGNVWGTYLHGLFDNDDFRLRLLDALREKKGLAPRGSTVDYSRVRDDNINRWADLIRENMDMDYILALLGLNAGG
jgi:adenosylcobyric acid synthase